jgi:hypothetical protein
MTTESTATESAPANGAPNAADLLGTGKPGTPNRATHVRQNLRAGRDAIKAEFEAAEDGPKPATVADAPAEKADRDRAKDKAAVEAKDKAPEPRDTDDDETEDGEDKPAKVEAKADKTEDKPDAETSKRLASVQAAEKRSLDKINAEREQAKAERAAAAKERAELEAERKELAEYKAAVARADVDPVAALRALGVKDPAKLEYAAKQAYAAAKGDPGNKEAAARLMREQERDARLERLEKQLADREKADAEREQHTTIRQHAEQFMGNVQKAAGTGTVSPLAKHFLAKDPEHTQAELRQIAVELSREIDDVPDVDDVLARFEKKRRADLARFGVDPDSILKTEQKKLDPEATKKTVAKTLGNDLSTTNVPRPSTSERELRRELRAKFESGKLD